MNNFSLLSSLKENGKNCTGCGSCYNKCPVDAISMSQDILGFFIPIIEPSKCIDCTLCEQVCPVINEYASNNDLNPACYAVQASDEIRHVSSSGGAFSVIAEQFLGNGGVVCGVTMENDLSAKHICIDKMQDLSKLRKSKYVQSDIGMVYRDVEKYLSQNKNVLFTGTPCQVAGLNAFLGEKKEGLYTIDIICHGVPSQKMLCDSLSETFDIGKISTIDFRDKDYGWESLSMTIKNKDGSKKRLSYDESRYEQGFHPGMTLNESCYSCKFCEYPRQGDISIGDFWRIDEYIPAAYDEKGTSAIIINSDKGADLFSRVKDKFKKVYSAELKWLNKNRVFRETPKDNARNRFLELYPRKGFNRAVYLAQQGKYDIGIVGNWSYPNYGSALTYFSLFEVLKEMNYSVGFISWPYSSKWKPYKTAELFRVNPYSAHDIIPIPKNREDLFEIANKCDTFVLGSDQLLNNNLYKWYDKFVQMDWVPSFKRKIAYAASFGSDYIWGDEWDHSEMSHFLRQFDAFSIRESTGKDLLKNIYGVSADVVLDPVFLLDKVKLDNLAGKGLNSKLNSDYLFAYILDPSKEKGDILHECCEYLNLLPVSANDAAPAEHKLNSKWDIETLYGVKLEDWLSCIKNSKFVITDSFHGMCVAILFEKPFLAIANQSRGATRFQEILSKVGLESRLLSSLEELPEKRHLIEEKIDYQAVALKLRNYKKYSYEWLKKALSEEFDLKELTDYDILSRKINVQNINFSDEQKKQWEQLEDHRLRLDGVDAHIDDLRAAVSEEESATRKQWEQLEDHRLRLDGVDAHINDLRAAVSEEEDATRKQWEQLEDHRIRLNCINAYIKELNELINEEKEQIEGLYNLVNNLNIELIKIKESSILYRIKKFLGRE